MHSQHCYSVRLMKPFARVLRTYPNVPKEAYEGLEALDPDARIPIATVHELLRGAIVLTGDEDIGLKAAAMFEIGDYGALEYAASTAPTGGEALAAIGRYMHLLNDALTFATRIEGERVVIALESAVVLPRAAEDFEMVAFLAAIRVRMGGRVAWPFEAHFSHPEPADTRCYAEVLSAEATVRFDQPVCGFTFPTAALAEPIPSADPRLHVLVRGLADRMLADLPRAESFTERVRERLMEGLASGNVHGTPGGRSAAREHEHPHAPARSRRHELQGAAREHPPQHGAALRRRDRPRAVRDRLPARLLAERRVPPRLQALDRSHPARVPDQQAGLGLPNASAAAAARACRGSRCASRPAGGRRCRPSSG